MTPREKIPLTKKHVTAIEFLVKKADSNYRSSDKRFRHHFDIARSACGTTQIDHGKIAESARHQAMKWKLCREALAIVLESAPNEQMGLFNE